MISLVDISFITKHGLKSQVNLQKNTNNLNNLTFFMSINPSHPRHSHSIATVVVLELLDCKPHEVLLSLLDPFLRAYYFFELGDRHLLHHNERSEPGSL